MRTCKNILTALLLALCVVITPFAAEAQRRKVPKYLPDTVAAVLCRITLAEVAGSYVKIESIKLIGDEQTEKQDSTADDEERKRPVMEIRASEHLAFYPMRPESVERLYSAIRKKLPKEFEE